MHIPTVSRCLYLLIPVTLVLSACQSSTEPENPSAQYGPRMEHREGMMRPGPPMNRSFRTAGRGFLGNRSAPIDLNKDGSVSEAEFLRPIEQRNDSLFLRLDRNGDNLLSAADLQADNQAPSLENRRNAESPFRQQLQNCVATAGLENTRPMQGEGDMRETLKALRENGASLDLAAFVTPIEEAALTRFRQIDADNDSSLNKEELQAAASQRREQRMASRQAIQECLTEMRNSRENSTAQPSV